MLRNLFVAALCVACVVSAKAEELNLRDFSVKVTGPGSGAQVVEEGTIALLYRAHLISDKDWVDGSHLTFDWQPPENVKADDGRTYGDTLCIRIRSNGGIRSKRSYEATDGIIIRIDPTNGDVYVQKTSDGENFENLRNGFKKGSAPISAEWHSVSVLDTDGGITVSIDGKVILTADLPAKQLLITKVWGIYNREPVGPGKKMSLLRKMNFVSPEQKK